MYFRNISLNHIYLSVTNSAITALKCYPIMFYNIVLVLTPAFSKELLQY